MSAALERVRSQDPDRIVLAHGALGERAAPEVARRAWLSML